MEIVKQLLIAQINTEFKTGNFIKINAKYSWLIPKPHMTNKSNKKDSFTENSISITSLTKYTIEPWKLHNKWSNFKNKIFIKQDSLKINLSTELQFVCYAGH